jgi:hypothetical protein
LAQDDGARPFSKVRKAVDRSERIEPSLAVTEEYESVFSWGSYEGVATDMPCIVVYRSGNVALGDKCAEPHLFQGSEWCCKMSVHPFAEEASDQDETCAF